MPTSLSEVRFGCLAKALYQEAATCMANEPGVLMVSLNIMGDMVALRVSKRDGGREVTLSASFPLVEGAQPAKKCCQ